MSLVSLPSLAEQKISDYLSGACGAQFQQITPTGNVSGSYSFVSFFKGTDLNFPAVIIKVGKLTEVEPNTHVYEGDLAIGVVTNVDTAQDAVLTHDSKVGEVYDALSNKDLFLSGINGGPTLHVHDYYNLSYDQDLDERGYKSLLEYKVMFQSSAI